MAGREKTKSVNTYYVQVILIDAGKSLRSLDGFDKFLSELLVTFVRRQVEAIETVNKKSTLQGMKSKPHWLTMASTITKCEHEESCLAIPISRWWTAADHYCRTTPWSRSWGRATCPSRTAKHATAFPDWTTESPAMPKSTKTSVTLHTSMPIGRLVERE